MEIISKSVEDTRAAGALLAAQTGQGCVYCLIGDMGCGKTEFVRGFVSGLCGKAAIRSPTFSIVNTYEAPEFNIYHFDFYRLKNSAELFEIGYYEYINEAGVCLIEWADMFPEVVPKDAITIKFEDKGNGERLIQY
jgi:tRNA threonylcarbamoyladenosine biosynthesis protein TsaE